MFIVQNQQSDTGFPCRQWHKHHVQTLALTHEYHVQNIGQLSKCRALSEGGIMHGVTPFYAQIG